MTIRCIVCVLSGSLVAGLMLSMMVSSSQGQEPAKKEGGPVKKPSERSERAKKLLEALDRSANPTAKPPANGKGPPLNPPANPPMNPLEANPAQQIQQFLALADADGNGLVSRQEMGAALQQMGPLGQQLMPRMAEIFRGMDRNRDDQISPEEARAGLPRWLAEMNNARPKGENNGGNHLDPRIAALTQALIARLDRNRDGKISDLETGGDKQIGEAFGLVDADGDKQLSAEEIYRFLQKTVGGQK